MITKKDLETIRDNIGIEAKIISRMLNDKFTPKSIKHYKVKIRNINEELIEYIKEYGEKLSPGEMEAKFGIEAGTVKCACLLYDINKPLKGKPNSYTKKEVEFCKKYYSKYGLKHIAEELQTSETRIRVLASKLGLKRSNKYSKEIEKSILQDVENGMRIEDISKKYNRGIHAIESFLSRRNIEMPVNANSPYYISKPELYMIQYISKELGITVPDKTDPNNKSYYWNVVGRYEIDLPLYIEDYKFAIEYDGSYWHDEKDHTVKDKDLKDAGYIVFHVNSKDHKNNYYDLRSLDPVLDQIVNKIKTITGSL